MLRPEDQVARFAEIVFKGLIAWRFCTDVRIELKCRESQLAHVGANFSSPFPKGQSERTGQARGSGMPENDE